MGLPEVGTKFKILKDGIHGAGVKEDQIIEVVATTLLGLTPAFQAVVVDSVTPNQANSVWHFAEEDVEFMEEVV